MRRTTTSSMLCTAGWVLSIVLGITTFAKAAVLSGELEKWHVITLDFSGPESSENATPNPFLDCRLDVTFTHGDTSIVVPGYYAADGNAAETGADKGNVWRVHFVPDQEGEWTYRVSFQTGPGVAISLGTPSTKSASTDDETGSFTIGPSNEKPPNPRARGVIKYTGERYLRFAETGEPFLKGGADSPENILGYADFDQTPPTHRFEPHAGDWRVGDPTWRGGKGKGLIGAMNYLASKGMNSVYFMMMNVEGDGKDVWPWTRPDERYRFDCSKLAQWERVFTHMDTLGIMLHLITQETENDQLLDEGALGPQRKLYYRELIARFGHHLALVWNLGEENTNTDAQRKEFAHYIRALDPYDHPIVVHTYPSEYDKVYEPLLGFPHLEGPSLQMGNMRSTHAETLKWVGRSAQAGRPWFVCLDEIGPPKFGVAPDTEDPEHDEVRRYALWGNLMAGGAGCEWYMGYDYPNSDLTCEDWRARDHMWNLTRYALEFFHKHIPFTEMTPNDSLVAGDGAWCLAKPGEVYAVYLWKPKGATLVLPKGTFNLSWYNPRKGGALAPTDPIKGPGETTLGDPPCDPDRDWVVLVQRMEDAR